MKFKWINFIIYLVGTVIGLYAFFMVENRFTHEVLLFIAWLLFVAAFFVDYEQETETQ